MKKIFFFPLCFFLFSLNISKAATLNLKLFFNGYYIGSGSMNSACGTSDSILVVLHDTIAPYTILDSTRCHIMVDGTGACIFPNSVISHAFYIAIIFKNAVETWSANPVTLAANTTYDFSIAATQAYANNMILVDINPDIYAIYQGDINQDGNIDLLDFPPLDFGINHGLFGCYDTDLNGDGNVDLLDLPILNLGINSGIFSQHP